MARIRTIKPDFWDSADTARADLRTRLLYIAMWNWADDYGIGDGHPGRIINFAFPSDDIAASDYPRLLADVSRAFGVVFFEHLGRPYYTVPAWDKHQRTEKKAKPKDGLLEAAVDAIADSVSAPQDHDAEYPQDVADYPTPTPDPSDVGSRKSEGEREDEKELAAQAPPAPKVERGKHLPESWRPDNKTIEWARQNHSHLDLRLELEKFCNHWHAASGQSARKRNWDMAFRNWLMNAKAPLRAVVNGSPMATSDLRVMQVQALKDKPTSHGLELE